MIHPQHNKKLLDLTSEFEKNMLRNTENKKQVEIEKEKKKAQEVIDKSA
jgi:hypothetical protein